MPAIVLTGFSGEQPRIIPTLLPATAAKSAINVRLDDGGLTPIHSAVQVANAGAANHKTIYLHGATWLSWLAEVNAAPGPVASERLYYTGDGAPKMRDGAGTVYALALPMAAGALVATLGGVGAGDIVTRIYVYTWVTSFGEESEPTPASVAIDWKPGNTVTLSNFVNAPAGRAITKQRIYRSQTGQTGTYLYLIAERNATNANFADTVAVGAFQEPLPSQDWNPPSADLKGLIALPNGIMAAFVDQDLYFSEPYRPHAWPQKYSLNADFEIVGLGAIGGSVVVMTKGNPYFVTGSHPSSMQMTKLEQNLPCINSRGIADLGTVIAYPSNEGLVAVRGDGGIGVITANMFNRDTWLTLSPSTMLGGQIAGRYVGFYDTVDFDLNPFFGALLIDIGDSPYLIRSSARASSVHYHIPTGALYFLDAGETDIFRFDDPLGGREVYYWRSKEFYLSAPENFGAILVDADGQRSGSEQQAFDDLVAAIIAANAALIAAGSLGGEINGAVINAFAINGDALQLIPDAEGLLSVGVYADGVRVASIGRTGRAVRLPGGFLANRWELDVTGDRRVNKIIMGKTMDDIKAVQS